MTRNTRTLALTFYAAATIYPLWSYFPRNVRPPTWTRSFVEVVKQAGLRSDLNLAAGSRT